MTTQPVVGDDQQARDAASVAPTAEPISRAEFDALVAEVERLRLAVSTLAHEEAG